LVQSSQFNTQLSAGERLGMGPAH